MRAVCIFQPVDTLSGMTRGDERHVPMMVKSKMFALRYKKYKWYFAMIAREAREAKHNICMPTQTLKNHL